MSQVCVSVGSTGVVITPGAHQHLGEWVASATIYIQPPLSSESRTWVSNLHLVDDTGGVWFYSGVIGEEDHVLTTSSIESNRTVMVIADWEVGFVLLTVQRVQGRFIRYEVKTPPTSMRAVVQENGVERESERAPVLVV
jgi:hypothetical protein